MGLLRCSGLFATFLEQVDEYGHDFDKKMERVQKQLFL